MRHMFLSDKGGVTKPARGLFRVIFGRVADFRSTPINRLRYRALACLEGCQQRKWSFDDLVGTGE